MLRFDSLTLDCNDKRKNLIKFHLKSVVHVAYRSKIVYIYDGAHIGKEFREISCRDTVEKIGTLLTRTNHVTLKYGMILVLFQQVQVFTLLSHSVTDNWGNDNGFKLVITAIKDGSKT